jgi:hypothetical protein
VSCSFSCRRAFTCALVSWSLGVANEAFLPGFEKLLAPAIVESVADPFTPTELSDGKLTS